MDRRTFVTAALAMGASTPVAAAAPPAGLSITDVMASPERGPSGARNITGNERGVLTYRVRHGTARTYAGRLTSYWNANWRNDPYQCVELIKRYAASLSLPGFESPVRPSRWPALGNAKDTARIISRLAPGLFGEAKNSGVDLPKRGSILSIPAWTNNEFGHVGIVSIVHWSGDRGTVRLFDQNSGQPSSRWTEIAFSRPVLRSRNPAAARPWTGEYQGGRVTWTEATG